MASYTLFVVLIAFSAVGYSNGDEYCEEEHQSSLRTKICKNKPAKYSEYEGHINSLIKQNEKWKGFEELVKAELLAPKYSGDYENCKAVTTIETPYMLQRDNETHYVVQSPFFKQQINVTRCKDIYSKCLTSVFERPNTSCEEKTGAMSIYVYEPKENKLVYRSFNFPVCCTCKFVDE